MTRLTLIAALALTGCAVNPHPDWSARQERVTAKVCGPDGANDWDDHYGPACERNGWNGREYALDLIVLTFEDLCNWGEFDVFTDEHGVRLVCPREGRAQ